MVRKTEYICSHATFFGAFLSLALATTAALGGVQEELVCTANSQLESTQLVLQPAGIDNKYKRIEMTEKYGERAYNEIFDLKQLASEGLTLDLQLEPSEIYTLKKGFIGYYVQRAFPLADGGLGKTSIPLDCKRRYSI